MISFKIGYLYLTIHFVLNKCKLELATLHKQIAILYETFLIAWLTWSTEFLMIYKRFGVIQL